ncbi:MAG: hypothetical protein JWR74_93 [Polaromonas sp.]|nr:hypothetical protein [Polaromonas sp.]
MLEKSWVLNMKNYKISIALATFNGAEYLQEQLESILNQSCQPDELIACDDGSTDKTLKILEAFSASSRFDVKVVRNEEQLGYARNFEKAISLCSGNVIFLCDQDDTWHDTKIEKIIREFKSRPTAWIIVNDAELTDAALTRTGLTVAGQLTSSGLRSEQLLLGCCIAFRSELKPLVFPIPYELHGHDGWINTLGNALGCRHFFPEVLQLYRRHGKNTSEWVTTSTSPARRRHLFKEKIRWSNIKRDPRMASAQRLEKINVLNDRLLVCKSYLQAILPHEIYLDKIMLKIENERCGNEARQLLQQQPFGTRLFSAIGYYFSGGYRQFEGWKSLVRDIAR